MPYEVILGSSGARAKVRDPWSVLLLSFLPLYNLWWWAAINNELAELGDAADEQDLQFSPRAALWAYALGFILLFIPTIWTIVATVRRIRTAQRLVGLEPTLSGGISGLLWVFTLGIGAWPYTHHELNKVWRSDEFDTATTRLPATTQASLDAPQLDLERLERLAKLRESGALTDDEYQAEKAKLLGDPTLAGRTE